ncbi:hypothetical protein HF289_13850 [Acidithiobacillus ferrooxidans]|uniref:DNA-binding protein n=1 Tax=Acidithiobacillus ferrooxidans TaxID=920 RepID=UPI001C070D03|nr:DNA-binding protein [Acidithiobacillus ferrooxidans]MBU2857898.1 hypothetical protein [Acidithiobacillus ferrooxidans]MBU2859530.1 hypothetical protein [Acidithiobacillus ferrooxidans]
MDEAIVPPVPAGPITADDVRSAVEALGGPNRTNAAAIRARIGRGSLATIQKHLQAIRDAESAPAMPEDLESAPAMPSDLTGAFQAVWSAAWAMAERRHAALLAQFSTESRTLAEGLETALSDLAEMAEQVDCTEARARAAEARAKEAEEALVQERAVMAGERQALEAVMARLRGMLSSEGRRPAEPD